MLLKLVTFWINKRKFIFNLKLIFLNNLNFIQIFFSFLLLENNLIKKKLPKIKQRLKKEREREMELETAQNNDKRGE